MIDAVGDRLPTFTPEQSQRLKGSYDFYGITISSSFSSSPSSLFLFRKKLLIDF